LVDQVGGALFPSRISGRTVRHILTINVLNLFFHLKIGILVLSDRRPFKIEVDIGLHRGLSRVNRTNQHWGIMIAIQHEGGCSLPWLGTASIRSFILVVATLKLSFRPEPHLILRMRRELQRLLRGE
jgi:hypothetical protein